MLRRSLAISRQNDLDGAVVTNAEALQHVNCSRVGGGDAPGLTVKSTLLTAPSTSPAAAVSRTPRSPTVLKQLEEYEQLRADLNDETQC